MFHDEKYETQSWKNRWNGWAGLIKKQVVRFLKVLEICVNLGGKFFGCVVIFSFFLLILPNIIQKVEPRLFSCG